MRNKIKTLLIQLLILLVLGEIVCQFFYSDMQDVEHLHINSLVKDDEVGWKVKPNYSFKDTLEDAAGVSYAVDYQTVEGGLKKINTIVTDTLEKRVLFIGDSYTQAIEVSNLKTYYGLLEERMNIEVYAYAAGGYSTLQEFLMLEKLIKEMHFDLVVWQFCSNDFIDNHHLLELEANYKIGVRRPYLTLDDKIKYHTPVPTLLQWSRKSKLAFAIYLIKENIKSKIYPNQKSAEEKISVEHFEYKKYQTSFDITTMLLQKIKRAIPSGTELLFFPADAYNPQLDDYIQICRDNTIHYEISVAHRLNKANFTDEEIIFAHDGWHWNERGHEVVADALEGRIRKMLFEQ